MVQGMFQPNINRSTVSRTNESHLANQAAESKEHAADIRESIVAMRAEVADLKEEISGRVRVRDKDSGVSRKDAEETHQQSQTQSKGGAIETNEQQFQKQATLNTHDHGEGTTAAAERAGALMSDEEIEKLKKKNKKSTGVLEKLNLLGKLEGDLKLFKFKDPEKQKIVDEFFDNIGRIKNLKERLNQLEHIEREHEAKKRKTQ